MKRLLPALMLLFLWLCVYMQASESFPTAPGLIAPPADGKRVYLVHADELLYDKWQNNDAQVLIGNVQFEHDGARLYCDSANFFEASNSFEAWGHVRMVQGDTLSLVSDQGYYDGNQQMMEARDNVVLKHRGTTLYTDELYYDRIWSLGYFQNGGRLIDSGTTLVSDWGEYHTNTKMSIFYFDVKMTDKQFTLTTDSLYYDTQVKRAHIVGPSNIVSGRSHIYSELGYYNTVTEEAELMQRSTLDNDGRTLVGDSLWHNGHTGVSEAFVNVVYIDTVNKNKLTCDYGYYDDSIGYAMCTDRAVAQDFSQRDTLFMHADTFKVFTYNQETDSVYRVIHAYNKVRAYRIDMQAVCDSLVYSSLDSCMKLYHDPIVWNQNQQLFGEEIQVFMKDSVIDHAHVINQAFSIEELADPKCFNQVSSKEMFAFFTDGKIHEAQAKDNVLTVYFPEDKADSSYVGLIYLETSEERMFMEDAKLSSIWTPKAEGTMYPMSQIPPDKRYLEGFNWFDYIRPLSKDDIFDWRPKKEGTQLVPEKPRTPPGRNALSARPPLAASQPAVNTELPAETDDAPVEDEESPAEKDNAPAEDEESPAGTDDEESEIPTAHEETPSIQH